MRPLLGLAVTALAAVALAAPAAAPAASITLVGSELHYDAAPGENNMMQIDTIVWGETDYVRWWDWEAITYTSLPDDCQITHPFETTIQKYVTCPRTLQDVTISAVVANMGDGSDIVRSRSISYKSAPLPVTATLGDGDDQAAGGLYQDAFSGGAGDDMIDLSAGGDNVSGGDGYDIVDLGSDNGGTVVLGSAGNGEPGWNATVANDFEDIHGGDGDDTLTGNAEDNQINRSEGSDTIDGGDGHDFISLETGTVQGGAGDDNIQIADPAAPVAGGPGTDRVDYDYAPTGVTIELGVTANLTGIEEVDGTSYDDVIEGDAGDNWINGRGGNDEITGGGGSDELFGWSGDDLIISDDGEVDTDDCGGGSDTVQADSQDIVNANCENTAPIVTDDPTGPPGGTAGPAVSPLAPVVTGVTPSSGPGGTFVGIDGDRFEAATAVLFGSTPASFVVDGYMHISAVAPESGPGAVDVTVVNANGVSDTVPADLFTYPTTEAGPTEAGLTEGTASDERLGRVLVCTRVPTLLRHTLKGARAILKRDDCNVRLTHKGHARRPPSHVRSQSVAPGTPLYAGDTLSVVLG